ncbi:hypothetical protein SRABI128_04822 [Microbacterium sp. Bi128]|nr:hypothetical protein SRABI128_04822 [Microbacterium sp. Bi128]
MRVDGVRRDHLAGAIHHGDLDAGAQSRVQAQGGAVPGRRGEQHIAQVRGEHSHGLVLGGGEHPAAQVCRQPRQDARAPGQLGGLQQPGIGGPAAVGNPEEPGHGSLVPAAGGGEGGVVVRISLGEVELQRAVLFSAQQRQDTVRGHSGRLLGELEVVLEFLAFGFLAFLHPGHHPALGPQPFPERGGQVGVLRYAFHQDGAGTGERRGRVPDRVFGVEVLGRLALRVQFGALEQGVGERLQSGFAGDLRLGAPLGFEREVDVLQPRLSVGADDGGLQFRGQRALGGNRLEDTPAAVLELAQVAQPLLQLAELGIVQGAGRFLPVEGDEGHGGPGVEQIHGGLDLPRQDAELAGDLGGDAGLLGVRRAGLW